MSRARTEYVVVGEFGDRQSYDTIEEAKAEFDRQRAIVETDELLSLRVEVTVSEIIAVEPGLLSPRRWVEDDPSKFIDTRISLPEFTVDRGGIKYPFYRGNA